MGHHPDDLGSKLLWSVGQYLPDYTVLHPRRQPSSNSSPWQPWISARFTQLTWSKVAGPALKLFQDTVPPLQNKAIEVAGMYNSGHILDASVHLLSRALVSKSVSVIWCKLAQVASSVLCVMCEYCICRLLWKYCVYVRQTAGILH
jgi:hypothetical protein